MKTKSLSSSLFLFLSVVIVFVCATMYFSSGASLVLDGESLSGMAGVGVALVGGLMALLLSFFALGLTSLILAGVAVFLVLLVAVILGSMLLALAPLLLPLLALIAVVMLISKRQQV